MKYPTLVFEQKIKQLNLYKGEVITLFISDTQRHEGDSNVTQIEIRKKENGEIELFVDNKITILSFANWYIIK